MRIIRIHGYTHMQNRTVDEYQKMDQQQKRDNATHTLEGYIIGPIKPQRITSWSTGLHADSEYSAIPLRIVQTPPSSNREQDMEQSINATIIIPNRELAHIKRTLDTAGAPIALIGQPNKKYGFRSYEVTRDIAAAQHLTPYGHNFQRPTNRRYTPNTLIIIPTENTDKQLKDIQAYITEKRPKYIRYVDNKYSQAIAPKIRAMTDQIHISSMSIPKIQANTSDRKKDIINHIHHHSHVIGSNKQDLITQISTPITRNKKQAER